MAKNKPPNFEKDNLKEFFKLFFLSSKILQILNFKFCPNNSNKPKFKVIFFKNIRIACLLKKIIVIFHENKLVENVSAFFVSLSSSLRMDKKLNYHFKSRKKTNPGPWGVSFRDNNKMVKVLKVIHLVVGSLEVGLRLFVASGLC